MYLYGSAGLPQIRKYELVIRNYEIVIINYEFIIRCSVIAN